MAHGSKDPLHGITLEEILTDLVEDYGWDEMGRRVAVRCFLFEPSIKSSLTFLRKTPWARAKVEQIYLEKSAANKRAENKSPVHRSSRRKEAELR